MKGYITNKNSYQMKDQSYAQERLAVSSAPQGRRRTTSCSIPQVSHLKQQLTIKVFLSILERIIFKKIVCVYIYNGVKKTFSSKNRFFCSRSEKRFFEKSSWGGGHKKLARKCVNSKFLLGLRSVEFLLIC